MKIRLTYNYLNSMRIYLRVAGLTEVIVTQIYKSKLPQILKTLKEGFERLKCQIAITKVQGQIRQVICY
eukprot:403357328